MLLMTLGLQGQESIPYLSFQELKALAPEGTQLSSSFDWEKLKSIPNQEKLIAECQQDFREYFRRWKKERKLAPDISDKLRLHCLIKGQKNKIIYFVFDLETEMVNDFFIVYYYSPDMHKFILKSAT